MLFQLDQAIIARIFWNHLEAMAYIQRNVFCLHVLYSILIDKETVYYMQVLCRNTVK